MLQFIKCDAREIYREVAAEKERHRIFETVICWSNLTTPIFQIPQNQKRWPELVPIQSARPQLDRIPRIADGDKK
jgi:hypothetical protein